MTLNLLVVCNAVTTNINQRIPAGKKTFSCKFKIVHDYATVNLRSLLCIYVWGAVCVCLVMSG